MNNLSDLAVLGLEMEAIGKLAGLAIAGILMVIALIGILVLSLIMLWQKFRGK